jgi:hypothetical protein
VVVTETWRVPKLDFDVVVPGTGPMVARADLEAFKTKIDYLGFPRGGTGKERRPQGSAGSLCRNRHDKLNEMSDAGQPVVLEPTKGENSQHYRQADCQSAAGSQPAPRNKGFR